MNYICCGFRRIGENMINSLIDFLQNTPTAYHASENVKELLLSRGFHELKETEDWDIQAGGKYFVLRGGSAVIAFTVGDMDEFAYKIAASHTDSPALKLKENPLSKSGPYALLNMEKYGGGIWYSFFDRPLKLAGRVVKKEGAALKEENVLSPFTLTIPSVAIHQNRNANEGFSVNAQVDLQPLIGLSGEDLTNESLVEKIAGENVLAYDLFLVNADMPYTFGVNDEFLASPRIDNLANVLASIEALTSGGERSGISVAACLDNEEIGSRSPQGADSDFLENTLRRIAYALRFDDNEYYKALASSFLLSVDNAHAVHPNHPEKSDTTNKVVLGKGVVIKSHANKAYITDATSAAIVKTIFDNADVAYQTFFNRSDVASGSTLGSIAQSHTGIPGADIGIAQLAMHSTCECFAKADYLSMIEGISAFYGSTIIRNEDGIIIR